MLLKITLFLTIFGLIQCQDDSNGVCGRGWTEFDGGCYVAIREPKSWSAAQKYCKLYGADLTCISSKDENDFVADLVYGKEAWIGLRDELPTAGRPLEIGGEPEKDRAKWVWTDDTSFAYRNWGPGQPSGVQDCVQINYGGKGLWDDQDYWTKLEFVCERPGRPNEFRRRNRNRDRNRGDRV